MQIKKTIPDALFIFMTPESRTELEKRLRLRGSEDEQTIKRRLAIADRELSSSLLYDYVIFNEKGKQEKAVEDFFAAVRASALTPLHQYDRLKTYFYND